MYYNEKTSIYEPTFEYVIDGKTFLFSDASLWAKHGFKHVGYLRISDHEGNLIQEKINTVYYYNRTWESYRFQTVNRGIVSDLISHEKKHLQDDFMIARNYKRMTTKRKQEFQNYLETTETPDLDTYEKLYKLIAA